MPSTDRPGDKLLQFFRRRPSTGYRRGGRRRPFGSLTPEQVHALVRALSEDPGPVEDLVKFVKGHRRVARELSLEDVRGAMDGLAVEEVMRS